MFGIRIYDRTPNNSSFNPHHNLILYDAGHCQHDVESHVSYVCTDLCYQVNDFSNYLQMFICIFKLGIYQYH